MNGYYIYLIFIEKYIAECTGKDLEDLGKVTMRIVERLNHCMGDSIQCRLHMTGIVAVIQRDTDTVQAHMCMNQLENELEQVLTSEYQSSFIYADYPVPEDHLDGMIHSGVVQYEHSFIAPNSRRVLELGKGPAKVKVTSSEELEQQSQLYSLLLKGDYEQVRLVFSRMQSEYQNETFQKQSRMRYRLSLMNMLFSLSEYTEEEEEYLGMLLFGMPMSRTWHRFMLSEMYRICQNRLGLERSTRNASFLQKVHLWIDKEISNPNLNLKMAADAFGLTPSYFSTVFKKNMQMNFLSYVENKRMNIGYALLNQGDTTVEKVAIACGYENVSTFRRNFKEFFGRNPVDVLYGNREG